MRTRVLVLIALGASAGLAATAGAAAPVEAPTSASASGRDLAALEHRWAVPLMFNSFDANKDGSLSREEARASSLLASQFDQLDKDGDGRLSVEELGAADAPAATARSSR
jgi:hypothetical protein